MIIRVTSHHVLVAAQNHRMFSMQPGSTLRFFVWRVCSLFLCFCGQGCPLILVELDLESARNLVICMHSMQRGGSFVLFGQWDTAHLQLLNNLELRSYSDHLQCSAVLTTFFT